MVALALAGDHASALLASERALAVARARGSLLGQGAGLGWRGLLQLLAGDLAQAELDAQAARTILSGAGLHAQEPASAVTIALALIERGALDEAQGVLDGLPEGHGWLGAGARVASERAFTSNAIGPLTRWRSTPQLPGTPGLTEIGGGAAPRCHGDRWPARRS